MGVYYACVANKDKSVNYQNALLVALPSVIDLNRFRKAVYDALCAQLRPSIGRFKTLPESHILKTLIWKSLFRRKSESF